jgi:hypothetical protein
MGSSEHRDAMPRVACTAFPGGPVGVVAVAYAAYESVAACVRLHGRISLRTWAGSE